MRRFLCSALLSFSACVLPNSLAPNQDRCESPAPPTKASAPQLVYFDGPNGIWSLDPSTQEARQVTFPPLMDDSCWVFDPERPAHLTDHFVSLSEDKKTLYFTRGGPCGFEAEQQDAAYQLDLKTSELSPLYPLATLVTDDTGTLWLGDAGSCESPGLKEPQTFGALWRSTNLGDSWEKIEVPELETAVRLILHDNKRPGALLIQGGRCMNGGRGCFGGQIFYTLDNGASWRPLSLPAPLKTRSENEEGYAPADVTLVDGELAHLILWEDALSRWETKDLGKTWQKISDAPLPQAIPHQATIGELTFSATKEGVLRQRGDQPGEKIFPVSLQKTERSAY